MRFRTRDTEQLDAAFRAVTRSPEIVVLESVHAGEARFTSRDLIEAEKSLMRRTASMASRQGHGIAAASKNSAASQFSLDDEQRRVFDYLLEEGDIKALAIAPGAAKAALLGAVRQAYESAGLIALGASPSVRGAADLKAASGLPSMSVDDREAEWARGGSSGPQAHAPLLRESVLFIDGSDRLGLKQLERMLAAADRSRAKILLIGDANRLRAMKVETPFHAVFRAVGLAGRLG